MHLLLWSKQLVKRHPSVWEGLFTYEFIKWVLGPTVSWSRFCIFLLILSSMNVIIPDFADSASVAQFSK